MKGLRFPHRLETVSLHAPRSGCTIAPQIGGISQIALMDARLNPSELSVSLELVRKMLNGLYISIQNYLL